ncbi:hypothetical protein KQI58_00730 [Enterococcus raffinosus]|uniref:hypothetical protein n=1 Tax=Enterococcus raffinosus TaxID=71452 RepID=UPI001C121C6D|nr:hypothetical protein [Enterococcus raffinosus]MBU5359596.1 hypothetical protein [Enterococcus raffinosus]
MDFDFLNKVFDILAELKIRRYVFPLMVIITTLSYLKVRHERKKITREEEDAMIEATYEKDENGLYPWETDTNDHPDRVGKNSTPLQKNWGPKRGQW